MEANVVIENGILYSCRDEESKIKIDSMRLFFDEVIIPVLNHDISEKYGLPIAVAVVLYETNPSRADICVYYDSGGEDYKYRAPFYNYRFSMNIIFARKMLSKPIDEKHSKGLYISYLIKKIKMQYDELVTIGLTIGTSNFASKG